MNNRKLEMIINDLLEEGSIEVIDTKTFEFPIGKDHGVRLKHMLEDQVDEKYYLSDEIQKKFKANGNISGDIGYIMKGDCGRKHQSNTVYHEDGYSRTLTAVDYKSPEMVLTNGAIRGRYNSDGKIEQQLELRNDGVTNTLTTVEKDNVIVEDTNKLNMLGMLDIKGNDCIRRVYGDDGLCPTITTMEGENRQPKIESNFRIRKLTPLECWRLQGFRDESFCKAQELGVSDSQLYKQAGNSITVNVLYYIFKNLFKEYITE